MRLGSTGLVLVAFLLVFGAHAQEAPEQSVERIVTTATRTEQSLVATPNSISVLDQQALELLGATHIEEAFKRVAGAAFQRGNGREYLPALRSPVLTGAGACGGLLTAEDGIALRPAGFCNINELFETHSELAQRVEVLKGPGSVFYGSNALHGVVNVVSADTTYSHARSSIELGSYGFKRASLSAGTGGSDNGVGVNATSTRDSGYRDGEAVSEDKISLRWRQQLGSEMELTAGLAYRFLDQDTAGYITGKDSYRDTEIAQSNGDPDAFRRNMAKRAWLKLHWLPVEGRELSFTPYWRQQDMAFRMHFLPGRPLENNGQQSAGVLAAWSEQLSTRWRLRAGIDLEAAEGYLTQFQAEPTQGSAFLQATVPQGMHYDYEVDAQSQASYALIEYQQSDWLAIAGLRYEQIDYDYDNHMLAGRTRADGSECGFGGCRYSRPADRRDDFSALSPSFSLQYTVSPGLRWFANLANGYRVPQASELYRLQREQTVADLDAVSLRSIESGLRFVGQTVSASVAGYAMHKKNLIYRNSDFYNVSDGTSRHRGVELELDWRLNDTVQLLLAASKARHTYAADPEQVGLDGKLMDGAPEHVANLQLNWQVAPSLETSLEWHHMGSYFTDPDHNGYYPGHELLNLRGRWQVNNDVALFARITNLLDRNYAERADYTTFTAERYFPGRPRSLYVSVQVEW